MSCLTLCLAALGLLAGTAATNQTFTTSGEMNIASCPITYYGQKYEKVYVAFDANRFAVCFNGAYQPGVKNDCIVMSGGTADRGDLSVLTKEIPTGSGLHKLLPSLKNAGKCVNVIPLKDSQEAEIEQVELGNFGTQAVLSIKTYSGYTNVDVVADAQVNGLTVSKQTFQANETSTGVITDMTGCRHSGVFYKTNTTFRDSSICSTVTCEVTGVASAVSDCGPMERCRGNDICFLDTMCTLTGSAVIDFVGHVHTVPDRCGYTLMRSESIPDFRVLGVFQERRRKDVSFLDQVILHLDGEDVEISLQQGGRVQLNNEAMSLNATPAVFHGVELHKDQSGVTAKISESDYTVSVFFDGNMAQIHMTGPSEAPVHGLCSRGTFSDETVSTYSASGCEIQHEEDPDSTINCDAATEWCNLLWQNPFTACHMHVNPESFTSACIRTLCNYPAVDGVQCQFLEAYARACSQQGNVTVEGWRSDTSCSDVHRALQDTYCSAHEFCGEKNDAGETRCFCRALFASEQRSSNPFGEPMVCSQKSASVSMASCLLEDKGIDYSVLHLNDETCRGEMDNLTHMVMFSFDSSNTCGAVVSVEDKQIIYKNTIMTRNVSTNALINRQQSVHIDFSCLYNQPDIESMAITIKDGSVMQHLTSGQWSYNLSISTYTDPGRMKSIQANTEIKLDERIWVELKAVGLNEKLVSLVTDSCWATHQPSPSGSLRYDLIIDGCPNPADQTVAVEGNGRGTSNHFSFNLFQFSGQPGVVFLHCQTDLCIKQSDDCVPTCNPADRRRRSVKSMYDNKKSALITLAWIH